MFSSHRSRPVGARLSWLRLVAHRGGADGKWVRVRLVGLVFFALVGVACGTVDEVVGSESASETVPTDISAEQLSTLESVPGRSTAGTAEQRRVEEAAFFWLHLRNQTGQTHLSLSDYASIRDDACGGAVNEPDALVDLSRRWGLGLFGSDKSAASAIWVAARNTCPEAFEDQDFAARRPPFGDGGAEAPSSASVALTAGQVSFVDLSIFDDPQWAWSGDQMIAVAMTSLSAKETVASLRGVGRERSPRAGHQPVWFDALDARHLRQWVHGSSRRV